LGWQIQRNHAGFQRANAVIVPSRSHACALSKVYGRLPPLHVIYNATAVEPVDEAKESPVLSVRRAIYNIQHQKQRADAMVAPRERLTSDGQATPNSAPPWPC
jgi:hypothetical protein